MQGRDKNRLQRRREATCVLPSDITWKTLPSVQFLRREGVSLGSEAGRGYEKPALACSCPVAARAAQGLGWHQGQVAGTVLPRCLQRPLSLRGRSQNPQTSGLLRGPESHPPRERTGTGVRSKAEAGSRVLTCLLLWGGDLTSSPGIPVPHPTVLSAPGFLRGLLPRSLFRVVRVTPCLS